MTAEEEEQQHLKHNAIDASRVARIEPLSDLQILGAHMSEIFNTEVVVTSIPFSFVDGVFDIEGSGVAMITDCPWCKGHVRTSVHSTVDIGVILDTVNPRPVHPHCQHASIQDLLPDQDNRYLA